MNPPRRFSDGLPGPGPHLGTLWRPRAGRGNGRNGAARTPGVPWVHALADQPTIACLALDRQGRVVEGTGGVRHLFGWDPRCLPGRELASLFAPNAAGRVAEGLAAVATNPASPPAGFTVEALRSSGERVPVEVHLAPWRHADGNLRGVSAILQVRAGNGLVPALKAERQMLDDALSTLGIGVCLIDVAEEFGRVVWVNRQMREWQRAGRFANGTRFLELACHASYAGRSTPCEAGPGVTSQQAGAPAEEEHTLVTQAGEPRVYRVSAAPIREADGRVVQTLKMVVDVTGQQAMDRQLTVTSKLATLGTLAASIAHEFNNILAGMSGYAELGLLSGTLEEVKSLLEVVLTSTERAKGVTGSVLAFARRTPAGQPADVLEAVENALALMDRELLKAGVEVVRQFEPVPRIVCDLGQIAQVCLNLIANARDAMRPDGGTLTIAVGGEGDAVALRFADTGPGIAPAVRDRLFEPFVTSKGGAEGTGTGLGLAVSRRILEQHGGSLTAASEPGRGATFTMRVPIGPVGEAPSET